MPLTMSELAANERSKRYVTAKRWASRRSREELEHVIAALFARQIAGIGQYGPSGLSRRREMKAVHDRTVGYVLKGKLQAKRGGQVTARTLQAEAADKWQRGCVRKAKALLNSGTPSHKLASSLASRFNKSTKQVRTVLQRYGLIEKRK